MTRSYLLKRIAYGLLVVVAVATVVFFVTHALGDPAKKMLPLSATEADYDRFRANLGLDQPIVQQYLDFMGGAATGDLGTSLTRDEGALGVAVGHLPNTFALMLAGTLVALLLAIPLGVLAATRPGSWVDNATVSTSLVGLSMPQFWLGAVLILIFAVQLKLLPTSGSGGVRHVVLPALAFGLPLAGKLTQMVRSTVIDELQSQYVVAARAKGLGWLTILRTHVLRNALVPVSSYLSFETARNLAGTTVVVETVFAFPGIGYLAVQALNESDLVLIQAVVLVVAVLVVLSNLAFDLFQAKVDPRIRAREAT